MKWNIRSNPVVLWIWISFTVIIPLIVFFLLFGETNILKLNWIIANNQKTPIFYYPSDQVNFNNTWSGFVNNLPVQYHEYFKNLGVNPETTQNYVNGLLTIDGSVQNQAVGATFFYPFATVKSDAIYIFLGFIFFQTSSLFFYHISCRMFYKTPVLSTDAYAFLFSFWFSATLLYYSGAFPGFWGGSNYAWYVIVIRIIILILGNVISFYFPFKLNDLWNKKFNQAIYFDNLQKFHQEDLENRKNKAKFNQSSKPKSIKLSE